VVADLTRDFRRSQELWIVRVPREDLQGIERVELVWEDDFGSRRADFDVDNAPPVALRLVTAAPNPFNPKTTLLFELAERQAYELRIYDARGRLVRSLADAVGGPGPLTAIFDGFDDRGRALASGSYRAVLFTETGVRSLALTLTK